MSELAAARAAADKERAEAKAAAEAAAKAAAEEAARLAQETAENEEGASALLTGEAPIAPPEVTDPVKEALGEGATNTAILLKLVEDGALTKEAVLEALAAKSVGFPAFGVPKPPPPPPSEEPPADAPACVPTPPGALASIPPRLVAASPSVTSCDVGYNVELCARPEILQLRQSPLAPLLRRE